MAIKLITTHKNGAKNIDESRQETNKDNLREAIECWAEIVDIDESEFPDFRCFKSENEDTQKLVTETLPSRLSKNILFYDIQSEITWKDIKKLAETYHDADPWLQINFCKDSTRQSIDEKVQRQMLIDNLDKWVFEKCTPSKYVYDGKLISKNEYTKLDPQKTRKDIDTIGKCNGAKVLIFQKYAKVAGGHQDNVVIEAKHFLSDADEYAMLHKNQNYFVAQLDGHFLEGHLKKLNSHIQNPANVFAGNTEEIVSWIADI